ncbi:MSMEG_6728 family protein [Cryptosporangium sp. NPDC048952]|uniref:MSMEG_6728 family protein n=1 Tax=Cryptosporangium sp. NPDC048952 TaxID=3363961 RepID=UPI00371ED20A
MPVADFDRSAELLDSPRLGKQRVETLQVLRALELPDYGWANHPVTIMWRGRTAGLVVYGLATVRAWQARGFADSTAAQMAEFAPDAARMTQAEAAAAGLLPSWIGNEDVHRSHRSNLRAKDPAFYGPLFPDTPDDLPYVWPPADDVPPPAPPSGVPVWIVRPAGPLELGTALSQGVVGIGTDSGVDVDATGLEPVELRNLAKELSGRRPAKALRQLSSFLDEMKPGDLVGVPVEQGAGLLLGEVVGDYLWVPGQPLPHRRPARFTHVVARSAARPPATLQDPRALFRVILDPVETGE